MLYKMSISCAPGDVSWVILTCVELLGLIDLEGHFREVSWAMMFFCLRYGEGLVNTAIIGRKLAMLKTLSKLKVLSQ